MTGKSGFLCTLEKRRRSLFHIRNSAHFLCRTVRSLARRQGNVRNMNPLFEFFKWSFARMYVKNMFHAATLWEWMSRAPTKKHRSCQELSLLLSRTSIKPCNYGRECILSFLHKFHSGNNKFLCSLQIRSASTTRKIGSALPHWVTWYPYFHQALQMMMNKERLQFQTALHNIRGWW